MEVTMALTARCWCCRGSNPTPPPPAAVCRPRWTGRGVQRFRAMTASQGGDAAMLDDPARCASRRRHPPSSSPAAGFVQKADADALGRGILLLGGGRMKTTDAIDPSVGVSALAKQGERVEKGAPLMMIHAADPQRLGTALEWFEKAFAIAPEPPPVEAAVTERIGMEDVNA
ncbi:MAG: hypothetical protein U1F77_19345 [Kiritimatiellia bacterium]